MVFVISSKLVPPIVTEVLADFQRAHGTDAWFWVGGEEEGWEIGAGTGPCAWTVPGNQAVEIPAAPELRGWLEVEPSAPDAEDHTTFLAAVLARCLKNEADSRSMGREIEYRYEEITLLYSISEILGSVISLELAAGTILTEVAQALRVDRAMLWVHQEEHDQLELVAAVGSPGQSAAIPVDDPCSVTAAVFRDRRPMILEPDDEFPRDDCLSDSLSGRDPFLSVPVSYTPPRGESRTIGVINLVGRKSGEVFSAGDQKLISAIASQIGAAVENSRLVAESLRQERLVREMELAHDLQLKLLPSTHSFSGLADVAARCVPAQSVGGDFYHLIRLPGGRFGVVIGDVSSHGFPAALIMALSMTAVAIHASDDESPAEVLRRVHRSLVAELESTEMYMTLFYGVIDPGQRRITYANAGHSHAFRIDGTGVAIRLAATNPPLGIIDLDLYDEAVVPWCPGEDLLFLFTDGLSDALGRGEVEGEKALLASVVPERQRSLPDLLGRVFALAARGEVPADDRTAVFVRI